MKTILTSTSAASLIAMFAFAQSPSSITADRVTTTAAQHQVQASPNAGTTAGGGLRPNKPSSCASSTGLTIFRRSGRNLWVYVITGDFQFGLIDLANGAFLPVRLGPANGCGCRARARPGYILADPGLFRQPVRH